MNKYCIMTDSSADIPSKMAEELSIEVLQLEVLVDGDVSKANKDIDEKDFYAKLREKKNAITSAVSIDKFLIYMEKILAEGNDLLYLGFSSALSGTYNAGFVAAKELSEKYR